MEIRDATATDWPRIWPFLHEIVAAGDTFAYDVRAGAVVVGIHVRRAEHGAVRVGGDRRAVRRVQKPHRARIPLGFETLATIPEGFRHPTEGFVGLLLMHRRL